jgi:hypothetical protein
MLNGHAQYAKGYVEETIGNVTGSKEWQEGGKSDTQAGIDEMKVRLHSLTSQDEGSQQSPSMRQISPCSSKVF